MSEGCGGPYKWGQGHAGQPKAWTLTGICHFGVSYYVSYLWHVEAQISWGKRKGQMLPLPVLQQLACECINLAFSAPLSPGLCRQISHLNVIVVARRGSSQQRLGFQVESRQCGPCGQQQQQPDRTLPDVAIPYLSNSSGFFRSSMTAFL